MTYFYSCSVKTLQLLYQNRLKQRILFYLIRWLQLNYVQTVGFTNPANSSIPLLLTQVCSCTPLSSIVVTDNQRPPVCSSSACCQHPAPNKTTVSMSENDGHMIFAEWFTFLHDVCASEWLLTVLLNVTVAHSHCSDLNDVWSSHIFITVSHGEHLFYMTCGAVARSLSEKIKIFIADGKSAALVLF